MDFLSGLIVKLAVSLMNGLIAFFQQEKLKAEAQKAKALEEWIQGRKLKEQADQILREEAAKTVEFSYAAWETMRTSGKPQPYAEPVCALPPAP